MLPLLLGHKKKEHAYLYWEFYPYWKSPDIMAQAVRMGKWKAVRQDQGQPIELYDLSTDLSEQHDVAAQHPDVVKQIEDILKTARTHSDYWPPKPTGQTTGNPKP